MSILGVGRPLEYGSADVPFQVSTEIIACRLLRWVVLFLDAQFEQHPILIEKAAAFIGSPGEMKLSEQRRKEGWRLAKDEAGYSYAHFEAGDANTPTKELME